MIRRATLIVMLALIAALGTTPALAADLGIARLRDAMAGQDQMSVAKRREIYKERAAAQDVPVDQVGRVYAKQILEKVPAGVWFRTPDGEYVQK